MNNIEIKYCMFNIRTKVLIPWIKIKYDSSLLFVLAGDDKTFIKMVFTGLVDKELNELYDGNIIRLQDNDHALYGEDFYIQYGSFVSKHPIGFYAIPIRSITPLVILW
jgi:hypothetical protein